MAQPTDRIGATVSQVLLYALLSSGFACCDESAVPAAAPSTAAAEDHASKCLELGFTGHNLCSDCKYLSEYVRDTELTAQCEDCCMNQAGSDVKYLKAVLEVCYYRLGGYPHIQTFVRDKAQQYKGLKVVDRWGAPPRITLSKGGKDGKQKETLRIDSWKTEQVEELLQNKLQQAAEA